MSRSRRDHLVQKPAQLRALVSPIRRQLVAGLESLGPSTVGELARHVGRVPESLYYHVKKLVTVGLVVEREHRPTLRREETVYELVAPVLRFDTRNRSEAWLSGIDKLTASTLRAAQRHLSSALRDPTTVRDGQGRQVHVRQVNVRLNRRAIVRLNALLEELTGFLTTEHERGEGPFYSVTTVTSPLRSTVDEKE